MPNQHLDIENYSTLLHQEILDLLRKRVCDFKEGYRQNVALLGEELIGKTTLLKTFLNDINDEQLIIVYTEIVPFELTLFCKRFLNNLFYSFLKRSQLISTREGLGLLLKRSKDLLPQTALLAEHFVEKLEKEKPETLFKELFAILQLFSLETKKKCVVLFDEFHNLKKLGVKNVCQDLGKKIMFEKNTLFIFASSNQKEAKEILVNDLSLLFGNFETIELQMPKADLCETLVLNRFGDIGIPKDMIHFLIHFTGGHPFYLKVISDEAVWRCRAAGKSELDKEILVQALEQLLFHDWGIFNLKFTMFLSLATLSRNKNDFIYVLESIAIGKNRIKDLASHLRKSKTELTQKINKLAELGVITRNGSFYMINDRLMCFWLKFVHFEKSNSLSPDTSEQAQGFKTRVAAEIDEFVKVSKKNFADRMLELFNLFEGDNIQIERKRLELSSFKELKMVSFDESNLKIGLFGKTNDSLWLAAIKEDGINEQDVHDFIASSKKFKHKIINKLIIGLGNVERNAKLLAKESHVMMWDVASINNIFDLYGQPRIIK